MRVTLVGMSNPNFENMTESDIIFTALSQCYNEHFDIEDCKNTPEKKKNIIIKKVLESGHTSVSEHISFTFLIEDVSRALTHQLVRHRIGMSYSQRSGRYTGLEVGDWYVLPPTINTPKRIMLFTKMMDTAKECYNELVLDGVPKEDARYGLPNGQHTNIVVTANCRALQNFFAERLCTRAQWEIRNMAKEMAKICKEKLPVIFNECKFGYPACVQNGGYCKEDKCCGICPHISTLTGNING